MSFSTIVTAIGSLAAIISGLVWVIKQIQSSQAQTHDEIDKKVGDEKAKVEKGERPQW